MGYKIGQGNDLFVQVEKPADRVLFHEAAFLQSEHVSVCAGDMDIHAFGYLGYADPAIVLRQQFQQFQCFFR